MKFAWLCRIVGHQSNPCSRCGRKSEDLTPFAKVVVWIRSLMAASFLLTLLLLIPSAQAQFGPDGTYWLPCKTAKNGACIGIIMHNDGDFWISEHHEDGTWTDIKPADCPNWHNSHVRRLSVTDPVYGDYRCSYENAQPGPFTIKQPVKEGGWSKFVHYFDSHKEVLAQDAFVVVLQSVWALKATEYHHTTGPESAWQASVIAGSNVAANHLWRWLVNKNGMNDGDKHLPWMWVTATVIVSAGRINDYEQGSNTAGLGPPGAIPVPRLPHYRN